MWQAFARIGKTLALRLAIESLISHLISICDARAAYVLDASTRVV